MKQFNNKKTISSLFSQLIVLATVTVCVGAQASTIAEPPTTFYGQVIGVGGDQPFLLHEGTLEWTIQQADQSGLDLQTRLHSLNRGAYSYSFEIPHTVQASGLDAGVGIPMPPDGRTNSHARALINGVPAEFVGPSGSYFEVGQNSRAATYRLDLMVDIAPLDSDGDGMPDWWEDLHGLDKNNPADGDLDSDGDGILNIDEYRLGLDPNVDNRTPGLRTQELVVYTQNTTGLRLVSSDVDSAAADLVYTISSTPAFGSIVLRNAFENPLSPDSILDIGSQFTQADVDAGRLLFEQSGAVSVSDATDFSVVIKDEVVRAPITATVAIHFYEPPASDVQLTQTTTLRNAAHTSGLIIWDVVNELAGATIEVPTSGMSVSEYAAYQTVYGDERGQYVLGGRGSDTLSGGMVNDIFISRHGANQITGGGGADTFVFTSESTGTNTVADFSFVDADVLDLNAKLGDVTGLVDDHIQFISVGADTLIQVDDLSVLLENQSLNSAEAYDLIVGGSVRVGALKVLPRLNVLVTDAVASENGDNSALFTIEREGDWSQALTAQFTLGGVAVNSVDYSAVALSINFAPGQKSVAVQINPFADSSQESDEIVELVLVADASYLIGQERGTVTIKDLQAVVGIDVIEPLATMDPLVPGVVLVTRNGQVNSSLFVRLSVGGKATNGSDYQYVSSYVNFASGQTVVAVNIMPLISATLDGGAEVVDISVIPDSAYSLADDASGRVTIISVRDTLAQWQAREFPDSTESLSDFASGDAGATGVDNLQRYAYGMDPVNPASVKLPQLVWREGHMTVDVHRNPQATDVTIEVEASRDMVSWTEVTTMIHRITAPEHATTADVETYEVVPLVETEEAMYVRIRIVYGQ